MATRMLQRRGTAAEWAAANEILGDGEIGYATDTKVAKIGDGVTAWNALASLTVDKARDADLLDGVDSVEWLRKGFVGHAGGGRNTKLITSLNQPLVSGWYDGTGMAGAPDTGWWLVQVIEHSKNGANDPVNNYTRQIAYDMTGGTNRVMQRRLSAGDPSIPGHWTVWERIDNDGILPSSRVARSGDTMTGHLSVPSIGITSADGKLDGTEAGSIRLVTADGNTYKPFKAGAIHDSGNRVFSASHVATITALGDILVGTGPAAVARLAKGAVGTYLGIDAAGNLTYSVPPSADLTTVVKKAGDTMTGDLIISKADARITLNHLGNNTDRLALTAASGAQYIQVDDVLIVSAIGSIARKPLRAAGIEAQGKMLVVSDTTNAEWNSATLEIQDSGRPRIAFHQPGVVASSIGQEQDSETIRTYNNGGTGWANFAAAAVYDSGNRVYSASNPPPASGAVIKQTIRGAINPGSTSETLWAIPAVVEAKTQTRLLGSSTNAWQAFVRLANSTQIAITSYGVSQGGSVYFGALYYELTEWS